MVPYTSNKEYKQMSSVEVLVYFVTEFMTFDKEYEQKCSVELLVYFLTDVIHFQWRI